MPLLSLEFALLTAGAAILTRLVPRQYRSLVLLGASLLFYAGYGWAALGGAVGNVLFCFLSAIGIERYKAEEKRRQAKALTVFFAAVQCVLMLCLGGKWAGFSFFSLILLSYVIDVWRGKTRARKEPLRFASFALFFPQMTQGPIGRWNTVGKQLEEGKPAAWEDVCEGLERILRGLLKKLVLADRLAVFVGAVYGAPQNYAGAALWLAMLFYAVEIYADFSGCMDIVIGAARLFGIRLAENFRQPYLAASFEEYWKRWHITMGGWFREYVFYPLAVSPKVLRFGKKLSDGRKNDAVKRAAVLCFPLITTWLCTGLWHGTAWHYLLWGLVNSLLILWESGRSKKRLQGGKKLWGILRTFVVTGLVRVLFRAESLAGAWMVYSRMWLFGAAGQSVFSCGLDGADLLVIAVGTLILIGADLWKEYGARREKSLHPAVRWVLALTGVMTLVIFGCYGPGYDPSEFFYSRF